MYHVISKRGCSWARNNPLFTPRINSSAQLEGSGLRGGAKAVGRLGAHPLTRTAAAGNPSCHTPRQPGPPPLLPSGKELPRPKAHPDCASHLPDPQRQCPAAATDRTWGYRATAGVGERPAATGRHARAVPGSRPFTHRWNREAPFPGLGRFSRTLGDVNKARTKALSGTAAGGSPPKAACSARLKRWL